MYPNRIIAYRWWSLSVCGQRRERVHVPNPIRLVLPTPSALSPPGSHSGCTCTRVRAFAADGRLHQPPSPLYARHAIIFYINVYGGAILM